MSMHLKLKISLGFVGLVFLFSCQKKTSKTNPLIEDISESVYASGIVKSKNQYQVFSTVSGIAKKIFVSEGDSVKAGTPLMQIFNKAPLLTPENAKLAADYASLSSNRQKLEEIRLRIELAKTKMANDSLLLERTEILARQNVGTRIDLEQKQLNYQNSRNAYRVSQIEYNDLSRQLILSARQSKNILAINSSLADEYILKSEVAGRVYNVLKEEGEMVNSQNPVATIGDSKSFLLELQVDEYDIVKIKLNQKVLITMDSYKDSLFEGLISKIDPIMNQRSKSFTVEAQFVKRPEVLYPFLTAETNIIIQKKIKALTIPRAYLSDQSTVLMEDGTTRKVVTGLMDYERVEILNGLSQQDVIINPEL